MLWNVYIVSFARELWARNRNTGVMNLYMVVQTMNVEDFTGDRVSLVKK